MTTYLSVCLSICPSVPQTIAQERIISHKLDVPLPYDVIDKYQRMCDWYQIVGSCTALEDLRARHQERTEKRKQLLREAQTVLVKKELQKVEAYIKRIEEGIQYHEVLSKLSVSLSKLRAYSR
jgi:hypothetical protein